MAHDAKYYLNEYENDSSLPIRIAELFALADSHGLAGPLDTELFLIVTKLVNAIELRHRMAVRYADATDADSRAEIAAMFVDNCTLAQDVSDQLAAFVRYLADGLSIPPA